MHRTTSAIPRIRLNERLLARLIIKAHVAREHQFCLPLIPAGLSIPVQVAQHIHLACIVVLIRMHSQPAGIAPHVFTQQAQVAAVVVRLKLHVQPVCLIV